MAKRPAGRLSHSQETLVRSLAGTMFIKDLAIRVGTSDSNLDRWAKQNGVNINALRYRPEVIESVCAFYERHGRAATEDAFPEVSVRSIVEHHKIFQPRQTRWTNDQIAEATKMAGLVSPAAQARYFNRPNANRGAIASFWQKRFGFSGGQLNGMTHWQAKQIVTSKVRYLKPVATTRQGELTEFRRLALWVDMEKCLRADAPDFIQSAIKTMADFQRWIWRSENPKPLILKMIRDREIYE